MIPPVPPAPAVQRPKRAEGSALRAVVGRVVGDKYGIQKLIGESSLGALYLAEHLGLNSEVTIKVLHPRVAHDKQAEARLRHEGRVAATLGHPNLAAILDLGRLDDGRPFLVMERLLGESLADRIDRGPLEAEEAIDIVSQVLSVLSAAHHRGIIHRDLRPSNIFLAHRPGLPPIPKLMNFGMSKAESIDDTAAELTGFGPLGMAPEYMAPEIAHGERGVDGRADLWSVGVILYEALSGRRPFQASNYNALLVEILRTNPKPLRALNPSISVALEGIVHRALQKNRDDRYRSALDLQKALLEAFGAKLASRDVGHDEDDATTVFFRRRPVVGDQLDVVDPDETVVDPPSFENTPHRYRRP